jgi:formate dehydrogenase (coenzyme F420) beta subunit
MKVVGILNINNGDFLSTLRDFLKKLFQEGIIEYLLVPESIASGQTLAPVLVKDPAHLDKANPFSPVMPASAAIMVSQLTVDKPGKKLGVVLKPCEIRALVELVKLQQANLENVTIIGIDCPGTFDVERFASYIKETPGSAEEKEKKILAAMQDNLLNPDELPLSLRPACRICNKFTPDIADVVFSLWGGSSNQIYINLDEKLAEKLALVIKENKERVEVINKLSAMRNEAREKALASYREKMTSVVNFADELATCIRCYACSSACPVCYCRTCFFKTDTFKPESERYYNWVEHEGVLRMPTETLLYHLTRMNHVSASCVNCGMCEAACPRNIPLTTMFATVSDSVQTLLNYSAGRSLDEPIPLSVIKPEG